jgi:hypothetical protein
VCAACGSSEARAQRQRPAHVPAAPTDFAKTVTVELDATQDVQARDAGGKFKIEAFQVGYFDGSRLVRSIEIPRSAATIDGTRVRLTVPLMAVGRGRDTSVDIKVRSLSSGAVGAWSGSAGSVTLPVQERPRPGGNRTPGEPRPQRPRKTGSVAGDLEQYPALKNALQPLLEKGAAVEQVANSFPRLQDLALSVIVSRDNKIPLREIAEKFAAAGQRPASLAAVLMELRPSMDARTEIRKARPLARDLLETTK